MVSVDLTRFALPSWENVGRKRQGLPECAKVLEDFGLVLEGGLDTSGALQRVADREDRHGRRSGWYVFHDDPAGAVCVYGSWHEGDSYLVWSSDAAGAESLGEKLARQQRIQEAKERARLIREQTQIEAAKEAEIYLQRCQPAGAEHPYLVRKQCGAWGIYQDALGNLVLPRLDEQDKLWSYQTINSAGEKRYQKDGRARGTFLLLKPMVSGVLYVCEGYATAATVLEATGESVAVAFDAGNLKAAGQALKSRYPTAQLVFAADNDRSGVGLAKAREAAGLVGGIVVVPEFLPGEQGTDFNDLAVLRGGLDSVIDQLQKSVGAVDLIPDPPTIEEFCALTFPKQRPILGPLKTQQIILVAALPGVGKTQLGLAWGDAISRGQDWCHWRAHEPASVLYIDGEMTGDQLQERLDRYVDPNRAQDFRIINSVNWLPKLGLNLGHPNLADPKWQRIIAKWAEPRDVVVIDNVMSLVEVPGVSMSSDEFWRAAHKFAVMLRGMGKIVIIIDHSNASGEVFGTKTKIWAVDFYITLSKPGGEDELSANVAQSTAFNVKFGKIRGVETTDTRPFEARLEVSHGGWKSTPLWDSTEALVIKLMDEGLSQREIAEELKLSKSGINRIIKKIKDSMTYRYGRKE